MQEGLSASYSSGYTQEVLAISYHSPIKKQVLSKILNMQINPMVPVPTLPFPHHTIRRNVQRESEEASSE